MKSLTPYVPGQSARQVHAALCAAVHTMEQAEQCSVLWFGEILRRKLYRELGYSSIYQYATQELRFSRTRIGDFIRLAKRLEDLPAVKQSVASGELGYTKAREVIKVATPETELAWLDEAVSQPRAKLADQVKQAKARAISDRQRNPNQGELLPVPQPTTPPAEVPVSVRVEMTPEQYARYEALWEKLHKLGGLPANKADVLLAALSELIAGKSAPRGALQPQTQIHIHQCPDCEKATVQTNKGELAISSTDLARAQCDATIHRPNQPNKSTIAPSVKRQVLTRDRHRCQSPGCGNTHFLEVHHIVQRKRGGSNKPENLVTLCSACHRLHHKPAHDASLITYEKPSSG